MQIDILKCMSYPYIVKNVTAKSTSRPIFDYVNNKLKKVDSKDIGCMATYLFLNTDNWELGYYYDEERNGFIKYL